MSALEPQTQMLPVEDAAFSLPIVLDDQMKARRVVFLFDRATTPGSYLEIVEVVGASS